MLQLEGIDVIDMASFLQRLLLSPPSSPPWKRKLAPLLCTFTGPSLEQCECMRAKNILDGPAARSAADFDNLQRRVRGCIAQAIDRWHGPSLHGADYLGDLICGFALCSRLRTSSLSASQVAGWDLVELEREEKDRRGTMQT